MLYLSLRKPKSSWSRSNKDRVARLIKEGLMTEAGLAVVQAAKRDGSWDLYYAVEQLTIPPDLEAGVCRQQSRWTELRGFQRIKQETNTVVRCKCQASENATKKDRADCRRRSAEQKPAGVGREEEVTTTVKRCGLLSPYHQQSHF
jgi:uncharacterized protein YdeI (YjbR/CyaY-like superfamily)